MNRDPFELQATIKKMERGRDGRLIVSLLAIAIYSGLYGDQLEPYIRVLLLFLASGAVAIMLDIRNARIDTLRASLRVVLIARNPRILDDPDY